METRAHYVLIGGFAIGVVAAIMLFALWFAKASFNQRYDVYDVVFQGPVSGLIKGGEVRFQGIQVGEITDLSWDRRDPNMVLARIRVSSQTPVRTSTVAQLEALGLTGVNLVQLSAGDPQDPLLAPRGGSVPRIKGRPGQFEDILKAGQEVASRASSVLNSVQSVLSPENVAKLSTVISDVQALTSELNRQRGLFGDARDSLTQLRKTAVSISAAADSIEALASNANDRLGPLNTELSQTLDQTRKTLQAVEHTADTGTATLQRFEDVADVAANETLPDLDGAVQDLRRMSMALETLANNFNDGPAEFLVSSKRPMVELDKK